MPGGGGPFFVQGEPWAFEIIGQDIEASYDKPSFTAKWMVLWVDDYRDAINMILSLIPPAVEDLNFNNIRMTEEGGGIWTADVMYVRWQSRVPGSLTLALDASGHSYKKTFAECDDNGLFIQNYFTPANPDYDPDQPISSTNQPDLPDTKFNGAIGTSNLNGKIQVHGVDEFAPTQAFTITRIFGTTTLNIPGQDIIDTSFPLTPEYVRAVFDLQRCVNSEQVTQNIQGIPLDFAPGELWFQGGTAQIGSDGHTEIVLRFEANPNIVDKTIATIPHVTCNGWDLLEVYYVEGVDANANALTPKVKQINVSQTKKYDDLNTLFN